MHDLKLKGPELLLIPPANRVGGAAASKKRAFVQVVGLLKTYLPLTVIVFVINVKWFTAPVRSNEASAATAVSHAASAVTPDTLGLKPPATARCSAPTVVPQRVKHP